MAESITAGQVFARRLRAVRTRRGWSQKALADRLAELGYPVNRVTLTRIEQGGLESANAEAVTRAKNVPLETVLAVSFALGVAPLHMIVPFDRDAKVSIISRKQPVGPIMARRWIAGLDTLLDEDPQFFFTETPPEDVDELRAQALRVAFGEPHPPPAFHIRQAMVETGEAPPIDFPEQEESS
jgi:transcriptional regulator with XRE-family HTH domain